MKTLFWIIAVVIIWLVVPEVKTVITPMGVAIRLNRHFFGISKPI